MPETKRSVKGLPRDFPLELKIKWSSIQTEQISYKSKLNCEKWAVVQSDKKRLSESALRLAHGDNGWCLLVVGSEKTISIDFGKSSNAFFLGNDQQNELLTSLNIRDPWTRQRKNTGYLFAIQNGAKWIWDFEDDNIIHNIFDLKPPLNGKRVLMKSPEKCPVFNSYLHMGAPTLIWPRGYPPTLITVNCEVEFINGTVDDVAIFQSIANHDPDVDGIFRSSQILPVSFERSNVYSFVIPNGTLSPYNSQALLSLYSAFWGLFLPVSVSTRVSDIWRSYITQRLLWDVGMKIAFTPPLVTRHRFDFHLLEEMQEENDLYFKSLKLVTFLRNWRGTESTLPARFEELYVELYRHEFVDLVDVTQTQQWLIALTKIGYLFPPLEKEASAFFGLSPPQCPKILRVLVTGVSGMIGSHVARELIKRPCYKIFGLVRPRSNLDSLAGILEKLDLLIGDITDAVRMNQIVEQVRPDYVYHFAAQSINGISYSVPELTLDTNVQGTFNVLESIIKAGLQKTTRLLVAGSSTEYGRTADIWEGPIPEKAPLEPVSPYGVSKVATENLARQYFLSHGVKSITARFFIQVGVGGTDSLAIHQFCKQIAMAERGLVPAVVMHGNLDTKRDMTDARDSASAVVALLETGEIGEAYNVGSGNAISISELLRIAVSKSKIKVETRVDESRFRSYDEKMLLSDPSKLLKLTGWVPSTDMEETVLSILNYWRLRVNVLYPKEEL